MNESLKKMLQVPYLKTIHSLAKRDNELYKDIIALKPGDGKITKAHLEKGRSRYYYQQLHFKQKEKNLS